MSISFFIKSLEIQGRQSISLEENDIVVFVGPNNCGKSQTLEDINNTYSGDVYPNTCGRILTKVEYKQEGSDEQFIQYLRATDFDNGESDNISLFKSTNTVENWRTIWFNCFNQTGFLTQLKTVLVNQITSAGRINLVNPPPSIRITVEPPKHPIHLLQLDNNIEQKVSDYFRRAFGKDLIVHRNAGSQVPLYVGNRPELDSGEEKTDRGYYSKIERLPRLETQGDGMKAYAGLLLDTLISYYKILILDEPELFLHPPQAKLIGRIIVEETHKQNQMFISTHSIDFIKGLLSKSSSRVKVIRINRDFETNETLFHMLDSNDVATLWEEPLLRHSDILNGLFYKKVILCESDADCRFYSAVLDEISDDSSDISEYFFTHCGGKHRMPTVISAIRKLNIPMQVICDIDILNNKEPLRKIYELLGGDWSDIEASWKRLKTSIDSKGAELKKDDLKRSFDTILSSSKNNTVAPDEIIQLKKEISRSSPWSLVKQNGRAFIPKGEPTQMFDMLLEKLEIQGLIVVGKGELENFDTTISGHGPKWVNEVLTKDLKNDSNLEDARNFVKKLL